MPRHTLPGPEGIVLTVLLGPHGVPVSSGAGGPRDTEQGPWGLSEHSWAPHTPGVTGFPMGPEHRVSGKLLGQAEAAAQGPVWGTAPFSGGRFQ